MKKLFLLHKQNFQPNINPVLKSTSQNLVSFKYIYIYIYIYIGPLFIDSFTCICRPKTKKLKCH